MLDAIDDNAGAAESLRGAGIASVS
jgi:hypothetical protein